MFHLVALGFVGLRAQKEGDREGVYKRDEGGRILQTQVEFGQHIHSLIISLISYLQKPQPPKVDLKRFPPTLRDFKGLNRDTQVKSSSCGDQKEDYELRVQLVDQAPLPSPQNPNDNDLRTRSCRICTSNVIQALGNVYNLYFRVFFHQILLHNHYMLNHRNCT